MIESVVVTELVVEQVPEVVLSELIVPTIVDSASIEYVLVSDDPVATVLEVD